MWEDLFQKENVLVLDTETTGLGTTDQVVDLALVNTRGDLVFQATVLPTCPTHWKAAQTHGLTGEVLRRLGARPWRAVHQTVLDLLARHVVIGWNVGFDLRMVRQTAQAAGFSRTPQPPDTHDLLADYRRVFGRKGSGLQQACRAAGVEPAAPAHRALSDCRTTYRLMRHHVGRRTPLGSAPELPLGA